MSKDPSDLDPETLVHLGCIATLNRGDVEKTHQFYTDDATYSTAGIQDGTVEDLVDQARMWQQAVPDLEADITETVVDDGEITFEYVVRGTQKGELADIPPTGESFEAKGVGVATLEEGLIDEYTLVFDRFGMFQQLGVV
ncbi:MAG: ester cyclase [Haloarculaceae archaeon]